jgi:MFS transporter, ACS family, allantoate permease
MLLRSCRKTKLALKTNTSRKSSESSACYPTLSIKCFCRVFEAFRDPKTWLFALFAAIENVPNSMTNQRQIVVRSFGFTPFQVTLLGCVDGVIEIITIWSGVQLASRIKNGRAFVGAIYFMPNLLGVCLIIFLPWSDKVGLLFGVWLNGVY